MPMACYRGAKKNAKGYTGTWNGFKLLIDVHAVVIPLMKLTSGKVTCCYDFMDAAYDAAQIWDQSAELNHVPFIDRNPRGYDAVPLTPHDAERHN